MKLKKKFLIGISLVTLLVAGCTPKEAEKPEDNEVTQEENIDQDAKDTEKPKEEKSIKEEVEKDESVNSAIVTSMESNGKSYILIDVEIAEKRKAEDLANKYADKYKEEYPDNVVDVKVMKDGETLVQETRE